MYGSNPCPNPSNASTPFGKNTVYDAFCPAFAKSGSLCFDNYSLTYFSVLFVNKRQTEPFKY